MKVSLSWLNQYVPIEMPVDDLVAALTMVGLEVETVVDRYEYLGRVRVGCVLEITPHPNADRLKICRVDIGDREISVVCGAPNVQTRMVVPVALPGTVLPDGSILRDSEIRGTASHGMICSEIELGLGADGSGVMVLDEALKIGTPLASALNLKDMVMDIDLTPNRPDCLSIIGVAREVAAIQKTGMNYPDFQLVDSEDRISGLSSVTIEAPDHCHRYTARLVTDIEVKPSPFWLQDRLLSVGLRPINNIVDITNFILMETGQPLHAFDFDQLADHRIVVRTAKEGERFVTLDEKERTLTAQTLMICDGEKPVGIGGVMGGLNSEIEDHTRNVLIESAYFNPGSIRKTAKTMGLNTEASHRFERGIDIEGTLKALNRATRLMAELGDGKIVQGVIDEYPTPIPTPAVELDVKDANRLLGTDLNREQMKAMLESIAFSADAGENAEILTVRPPTFRVDISRPEDLMEEVARLHGYDHIPTTFPTMPTKARPQAKLQTVRFSLKQSMAGFGFTEAINYSFIHSASCDRLGLRAEDPRRSVVEILNPISEDQTVMRTSIVPGLLETVGRNIAQQMKNLKLFEIGKTYRTGAEKTAAVETEMLAGLWTGARSNGAWHTRETPCDFYDIKGIVEGLLDGAGVSDFRFTAMPVDDAPYMKPGHTARITAGETPLGLVGEMRPRVLGRYAIEQDVFIFELDIAALTDLIPDTKFSKPLPKYPSVARDVTLIVDRAIETGDVLRNVEAQDEALVESVHLFDVYDGDPIPAGKKSISFRVTYRSSDRTLEDEVVNARHVEITGRLVNAFDAGLPA